MVKIPCRITYLKFKCFKVCTTARSRCPPASGTSPPRTRRSRCCRWASARTPPYRTAQGEAWLGCACRRTPWSGRHRGGGGGERSVWGRFYGRLFTRCCACGADPTSPGRPVWTRPPRWSWGKDTASPHPGPSLSPAEQEPVAKKGEKQTGANGSAA